MVCYVRMNNKNIVTFIIIAIIIIAVIAVFTRRSEAPTLDTTLPDVTTPQEEETEEPAQNNETPMEEPKAITTDSGLTYTVLTEGSGDPAAKGDTVVVNYTGRLDDGTVFDSNVLAEFNHVSPFSFTLGEGRVIAGWEEGVLGMKKGEKRMLVIPAELGYGGAAIGAIPPFSTLTFEVEVLQINRN